MYIPTSNAFSVDLEASPDTRPLSPPLFYALISLWHFYTCGKEAPTVYILLSIGVLVAVHDERLMLYIQSVPRYVVNGIATPVKLLHWLL